MITPPPWPYEPTEEEREAKRAFEALGAHVSFGHAKWFRDSDWEVSRLFQLNDATDALLKSLQHLHLWKSRITQAGVDALRQALPRCHVNHSAAGSDT